MTTGGPLDRNINIKLNADDAKADMASLGASADRLSQSTARLQTGATRAGGAIERQGRQAKKTAASMGFLNRNSDATQKRLMQVSAAAQGSMLGMSLLQRNVVGLGFSLIFLQFSILKTALAFAALTVIIGSTVGLLVAFVKLEKAAFSAGKAIEETGQRLAAFFRSSDIAQKILTQADEIARKFGSARQDIVETLSRLETVGLRTNTFIKAILNTAAATGESIATVGERFTAIIRADAKQREGLLKRFTRDFNIEFKRYGSALELAEALQDRFAGSAEAMANTTTGAINRMKASFTTFMQILGIIVNSIVRPVIEIFARFAEGLIAGFQEASKSAQGVANLNEAVQNLRNAVRQILPLVTSLGAMIGAFLFRATILAARGLKILVDVIGSGLRRFKLLRQEIRQIVQSVKELGSNLGDLNLEEIFEFLKGLPAQELTIPIAFAAGFTRGTLTNIFRTIVQSSLDDAGKFTFKLSGLIRGIIRAAVRSPLSLFKGLISGLRAGLVFALFEVLAFKAVDLAPISQRLREVLRAVIQGAFLGGAIGSVVPGPGTLAGAIIGGLLFGAAEGVSPGIIAKINDFVAAIIDRFIEIFSDVSRIATAVANWISDAFAVAVEIFGTTIPEFFTNLFNTIVGAFSDAFSDPAPSGFAVGKFLVDVFAAAFEFLLIDVVGFIGQAMRAFLNLILDAILAARFLAKLAPVLISIGKGLPGFILDGLLGILDLFILRLGVFVIGAIVGALVRVGELLFPHAVDFALVFITSIIEGLKLIADAALMIAGTLFDIVRAAIILFQTIIRQPVLNVAKDILGFIVDGLKAAVGLIASIAETLRGIIEQAISAALSAINPVNIAKKIPIIGDVLGGVGGAIGDIGGAIGGIFKQHGGTVPGPRGKSRLVIAEGGEQFGGNPIFADARPGGRSGGGGPTIVNTFDLRGSVITSNQTIDALAQKVSAAQARSFSTRPLLRHRI